MGCWESACCGTHVWNVTANSPVRHETSETHANDRIENRLRLKPESQVPGDVKGGEKTWIWEENFGDERCDTLTQSTWLEAILPTCSKKARKRFDYDFCAPSQSQSSLALSRLLWLLARCRWDSSNHAFSPWCPKKHIRTCHPKDQMYPNVTNATRLHNSKIGWGFHTTLLRCTVGKFQLTNPSAKLWQNENCDFPTSDLQETRWAFAQFRLPLNLRLQHPKRLELPLPLFYSKRLIQWLDLTICHFVEMNGYIQ